MKIKLTFIPNEKEDGLSSFISGFLLFVTPCITYEIDSEISRINNTEEGIIKMSDKQTLYYSNNKDNLYKLIKNSIKND
jgi:hypothetical protein